LRGHILERIEPAQFAFPRIAVAEPLSPLPDVNPRAVAAL